MRELADEIRRRAQNCVRARRPAIPPPRRICGARLALAATYLALAASAEDAARAARGAYVTGAPSLQDLNGALALAGSIKKWEAARRRRGGGLTRRRRNPR